MLKPLFFGFFFWFFKNKKNFYSPFFAKRCKKKILCWNILLRNFFLQKIWQKHSFFFSGGSSFFHFYSLPFRKSDFCEQTPVLLVLSLCISLSKKNSSVILEFLSIFCVFLYSRFFILFFVTFCFCSFRSHLIFSFPFVFDLSFSWLPISFNTISPSCVSQNSSIYLFLHARSAICPLLIHLFICCIFYSLRFFSFLTHVFPFSFCLLCP